jgi:hypothetical protein
MIEPVQEPNSGEFVSDDEECDGNGSHYSSIGRLLQPPNYESYQVI